MLNYAQNQKQHRGKDRILFVYCYTGDDYSVHSVEECYGEMIHAVCPPQYAIRVIKALYRQNSKCPGGFHSSFCSREEHSNPACVGNNTCHFNTPWLYISPECGYSNNFMLNYQCIPGKVIPTR